MTTDNAHSLRRALEQLFEARRITPELLAEDVEWVNPPDAVEPGTRRGREAFNEAIARVFATWDDVHFETERVVEAGDAMVALGSMRGHVHAAGMEVESPHAQVWTFRDGRVARMQWFNSHAEALATADHADEAGDPVRTPDDIALVESAFAAWNRGDIDGFVEHTAEDVVWVEIAGRLEGAPGERHGRERLRGALAALFEAWESYRLEIERLEQTGDRVLAVVREAARGRASGVEVMSRWGYLIAVDRGEIVRVEAYRDPELAIEAARS